MTEENALVGLEVDNSAPELLGASIVPILAEAEMKFLAVILLLRERVSGRSSLPSVRNAALGSVPLAPEMVAPIRAWNG